MQQKTEICFQFWVRVHSSVQLKKRVSKDKAKGKKVVLCHGTFDLLHVGHIKYFNEAKTFGNKLIVTVTSDKYVNKGPNRPIFPLEARMQCISALKYVDYVVANTSENAVHAIKILKPHYKLDFPQD